MFRDKDDTRAQQGRLQLQLELELETGDWRLGLISDRSPASGA